MSYEQRVRYRIRKFAKECGISVKELRKNMKDFGLNYSLEDWMGKKMFNGEYSKNVEKMLSEQFHNDGDIASLVAA